MADLFTAVADFIRERRPEARMLREKVEEMYDGRNPVTETDEEARAMGYENRNALRRARVASGEHANTEWKGEAGTYMGPYRRDAIDAEHHTQMYAPPINYGGWYRPRPAKKKSQFTDFIEEQGKEVRDDMVYLPSARDATPRILTHEFGHRANFTGFLSGRERQPGEMETLDKIVESFPGTTQESIAERGFPEHKLNYFLDAWRADSPETWRKAIGGWRRLTNDPSDYSTSQGDYDTYWKAHNELSELIQLNRDDLLDLEVSALEQEALNRRESIEEVVSRGQYSNLFDTDRIEEVQEELDRLSESYSPENLAEARERNRENLSDQAFRRYKQGRSRIGVPSEHVRGKGPKSYPLAGPQ